MRLWIQEMEISFHRRVDGLSFRVRLRSSVALEGGPRADLGDTGDIISLGWLEDTMVVPQLPS